MILSCTALPFPVYIVRNFFQYQSDLKRMKQGGRLPTREIPCAAAADRVNDMKKYFLICLAALCCLAGCQVAQQTPSSQSASSQAQPAPSAQPTPTPAPQSEPAIDLHEWYDLPETVEITDAYGKWLEAPMTTRPMELLKSLFENAMAGKWEEAGELVSSAPGVFDGLQNVKIDEFTVTRMDISGPETLSPEQAMVYFDLVVSESDSELFQVGRTSWVARLIELESNWAEYILPADKAVTTCNYDDMEPVEMFCFRLASTLPELQGTDFQQYLKFSDAYDQGAAVDAACVVLEDANLPEVEYTPETRGIPAFCENMEKVFGVDMRDVDLTQYSEYQQTGMVLPIPRGGKWVYAVTRECTFDQAQNCYTVTMDLYADTICWMVSRTVQYTVSVNEDGSFRLEEVKDLYSSGLPMEVGSI